MKKIIDGRKYDTDTAKAVGVYRSDGSWRDFSHYEETLYQKRTGEFFLHGEGGPMTRYAKREDSNTWGCGEQIIPMTYKEAREWAEENLGPDKYEAIFGEVAEDESTTVLSVSLPASLAEKIRREAAEAGMSLSAYIASKF